MESVSVLRTPTRTANVVGMTKRATALAVLLAIVACGPAQASSTIIDQNDQIVPIAQRWVDTSRAPTPTVTIRLTFGPCPYAAGSIVSGCSVTALNEMYIVPADPSAELPHAHPDFDHELCHFFDYNVLTAADRAQFIALIHLSPPWIRPEATDGAPNEVFAEACKLVSLYGTKLPDGVATNYGYAPTPRLHRRVAAFLRRAFAHGEAHDPAPQGLGLAPLRDPLASLAATAPVATQP